MTNLTPKNISRRSMLQIIGVGTASALLASCAPSPAETTEPTEAEAPKMATGPLTVLLCCGTEETHQLQEKFNKYFDSTYGGMKSDLQLTPAGQNYFEKLQTLFAAGTPPDVFDMWEGYVAPYAADGALLEMNSFIDADPEWKFSDFQPSAIAAGSYQDKLYAFIRNFYPGPSMFFYNKDLFDKAGQAYPTFDWDWNKMREAALALTVDTTGGSKINQWGLAFETWFVVWLHLIWSNGGDLLNVDETKSAIAGSESVKAIQYFADLINQDKCAIPSAEASAMEGASNAFRTNAIGMFMGYSWNIADMKAAKEQGLNWGCVLPPKSFAGNRSFYMHLECWAIAKNTKVPAACWQYIRDFTTTQMVEWTKFYPGIPMLKKDIGLFTTEENKSYGWDKLPDIIADPKNIRIPGAGAKFDKISQLVQAELDKVFIGDVTAQAAMDAVTPSVDEELARKG